MDYFTKDKPYNSLNEYYKIKYGKKIAKLTLNQNVTCPNIDGTKSKGGCIFCLNGAGEFTIPKLSIKEQLLAQKEIIEKKWPNSLFIPYFQSNTNTYAKLDILKHNFEEAINTIKDKTIGISIATRADAFNDEIYNYLGQLNKKIPVQIELGIQSSNEYTSKLINRALTNEEIINCCKKLKELNIEIVVHIINGLPYETIDDMLNTIKFVNNLGVDGIKFHNLLIYKNTKLMELYNKKPFKILTMDEYTDIVVKQICILDPKIIIHRLSADGALINLFEPLWSRKKLSIMDKIDMKLRNNGLYQGIYLK